MGRWKHLVGKKLNIKLRLAEPCEHSQDTINAATFDTTIIIIIIRLEASGLGVSFDPNVPLTLTW
jgi:hypothetical protein